MSLLDIESSTIRKRQALEFRIGPKGKDRIVGMTLQEAQEHVDESPIWRPGRVGVCWDRHEFVSILKLTYGIIISRYINMKSRRYRYIIRAGDPKH